MLKKLFGFQGCDSPEETLVWQTTRSHAHGGERKRSRHVDDEARCGWQHNINFPWGYLSANSPLLHLFLVLTCRESKSFIKQPSLVDCSSRDLMIWSCSVDKSSHTASSSVSLKIYRQKRDFDLAANGFLNLRNILISFHMANGDVL